MSDSEWPAWPEPTWYSLTDRTASVAATGDYALDSPEAQRLGHSPRTYLRVTHVATSCVWLCYFQPCRQEQLSLARRVCHWLAWEFDGEYVLDGPITASADAEYYAETCMGVVDTACAPVLCAGGFHTRESQCGHHYHGVYDPSDY